MERVVTVVALITICTKKGLTAQDSSTVDLVVAAKA